MTEIVVIFDDYTIPFPAAQTGTVAYARCAAWLSRYPSAVVTEKMGKVCTIVIRVPGKVPADLRDD